MNTYTYYAQWKLYTDTDVGKVRQMNGIIGASDALNYNLEADIRVMEKIISDYFEDQYGDSLVNVKVECFQTIH